MLLTHEVRVLRRRENTAPEIVAGMRQLRCRDRACGCVKMPTRSCCPPRRRVLVHFNTTRSCGSPDDIAEAYITAAAAKSPSVRNTATRSTRTLQRLSAVCINAGECERGKFRGLEPRLWNPSKTEYLAIQRNSDDPTLHALINRARGRWGDEIHISGPGEFKARAQLLLRSLVGRQHPDYAATARFSSEGPFAKTLMRPYSPRPS